MHFFTADTHFGHNNIVKYCKRPFMNEQELEALNSSEKSSKYPGQYDKDAVKNLRISRETINKMNTTIIDNINAVVAPNDTLWHLGDFSFARSFGEAKGYRDRINCNTINFIWGNHDEEFVRPLFTKSWGEPDCYAAVNVKLGGQTIVLSHFSMAVWDKQHHGSWHLYGHSHGTHEPWKKEHMADAKSFDVGVDCWDYKPLSLDDIADIMSGKKFRPNDHHGR